MSIININNSLLYETYELFEENNDISKVSNHENKSNTNVFIQNKECMKCNQISNCINENDQYVCLLCSLTYDEYRGQ